VIIIAKPNGERFAPAELPELRREAVQRLGVGATAHITALGRAYLYTAQEQRAHEQRVAEALERMR
jgi:hypothetical protein